MSPNNLILVAHTTDRSYVFPDANADCQWSATWAAEHIARPLDRPLNRLAGEASDPDAPRPIVRRRRAQALVVAHDLQRRLHTEYGVREVFLDRRR